MPSPFPGMDPYLEDPAIWPDFHDALASEIRGLLNRTLPAPYYARLEMRPEVGIVEEGQAVRRIVPDVVVARLPSSQPDLGGGVALLDGPRTAVSKSYGLHIPNELIRHPFVEIRDPSRGHHLITLIEIASPSNKRPGPDREAYLQKVREVLSSDANLIEVDLLRSGSHPSIFDLLEPFVLQIDPRPDYLVLVNRSWQREGQATDYEVFPAVVTDLLPVFPVPLRQGQPEVPLDLQYVANRAYDSGPYRRGAVDYSRPPQPPLADELAGWAAERVQAAGMLAT
jgi:Protein of unknown function (DUF4058)